MVFTAIIDPDSSYVGVFAVRACGNNYLLFSEVVSTTSGMYDCMYVYYIASFPGLPLHLAKLNARKKNENWERGYVLYTVLIAVVLTLPLYLALFNLNADTLLSDCSSVTLSWSISPEARSNGMIIIMMSLLPRSTCTSRAI